MDLNNLTVITTNGQPFTGEESAHLAYLVAKRFGFDWQAAAAAWRRMLGNSCLDHQFEELVMAHIESVTIGS